MEKQQLIYEIDSDLEELIPTFLENRDNDVIELEKALTDSNFELIRKIGHNLAGNCGSYEFDYLGRLGAQLQIAAKDEDLSSLKELVALFKNTLENLEIKFIVD